MRNWSFVPVAAIAALMGGCAADGSLGMTTASVDGAQSAQAKSDPACAALFTRIDDLRKDGVADKIEKAANKKYKMKPEDLVKADQLNKANADFQARCLPQPVQASATPPTTAAPAAQQ